MKVKPLDRLLEQARTPLEELCDEETFQKVSLDAKERHEALVITAPTYKRAINRDNFKYGTAGLAVYRALLTTAGLERELALEVMRRAMSDAVLSELEGSWFKRFSLGRLAKSKMMASMSAKAFVALDEPHGWLAKLPETDAHWAFDVHQCGLVIYLTEQDAPELSTVFCECDIAAAELMKGLRFERSGTLAEGAPICDFRYYQESPR